MEKGIAAISLEPYHQTQFMYVCYGIGPDDLIDKFKIDSDFYSSKPADLHDIRNRSKELEAVKDLVLHHKDWMVDGLNESWNGGHCLFNKENYNKSLPALFIMLPTMKSELSFEWFVTLSHECLHACNFVLSLYLNRDLEMEAEAYFHDYLMRETYKKIIQEKLY